MYLDFFNLNKEPFNITPDPDLLFLSTANREALAAIMYGVMQRKGFVAITGQVGVGKTTIIRSFLERNQGCELKVIYIFNADISFKALVKTIYKNLGYVSENEELFEMINQLHQILIDLYKSGANVVLIIDEAQNMPVETLRALHMLSNLETTTEKLIQIVLCGQPELDAKLDNDLLRQLKQRITIRASILPLTSKESLEYVQHRLARTAAHGSEIFTAGALRQIIKNAHGIPRVINTLCDNCLITSFGRQEKKVIPKVAREIIGDLGKQRSPQSKLPLALAAGFLFAIIAAFYFMDNPLLQGGEKSAIVSQMALKPTLEKVAASSMGTENADLPQVESPGQKVMGTNGLTVTRVVKRGDTLARLILEIYGSVDESLLRSVQDINPQIVNRDYIEEGEKISFPVKRISHRKISD